jgi:hypothetical protein
MRVVFDGFPAKVGSTQFARIVLTKRFSMKPVVFKKRRSLNG